ncbi:DUF3892 domain-containing protein [Halorientalis salina]|uniref:DUF3892 domain-containing protein n=1 Tax=Halorientalis salina TaxID=2932266 RepID=UPI0010AC75BC|nr:DUF3892 domain-containing protein [Halorientalis salina]
MAVRVTCVTKDDSHLDGCECITTIGWKNPSSGDTGSSSPQQMYDFIENDGGRAYVEYDGDTADLVAVDGETKKHVRTEPGTPDKNLLDQPSC